MSDFFHVDIDQPRYKSLYTCKNVKLRGFDDLSTEMLQEEGIFIIHNLKVQSADQEKKALLNIFLGHHAVQKVLHNKK